MPRCCRRKFPRPSWWEARLRPCTPAIAFPLTMITWSKTWQRTTTRPFAPWNPSPAGTHRRVKGKMVLGNVNKIAAGLRNQRRSAPLETTEVVVQDGRRLRLPTIEETLRIKTFLVVDRNATRDYLDVAALSHHIGLTKSAAALERMNELYAEFKDQAGDLLTAVVVKLSLPDPYDLTDIDLSEYKGIVAPWNNWRAVQAQCASLGAALVASPRL